MFQQFFQFTNHFTPFSTAEKAIIENDLVYREVPKKFLLVKINDICQELYFMNKGCARLYYDKDGEEITGFFFTENMTLGGLESFLSKTPSIQGIETLEPCKLIVIKKEVLEKWFQEIPRMHIFFRKLLEQRFIFSQKVVASYILNSPEERYLGLFQRQPELLNRVPQHMLATYLGITPVSLSRIRKRIFEMKK